MVRGGDEREVRQRVPHAPGRDTPTVGPPAHGRTLMNREGKHQQEGARANEHEAPEDAELIGDRRAEHEDQPPDAGR